MPTPQTPPILSVVGKSNSGKTTLISQLIQELKGRGYRIAAIKHHGHPTPFDQPGKDTFRHAAAGADIVIGASPVQLAIFRSVDGEATRVEDIVSRHAADVDLVLTEGYKRGPFPKIEVCRAIRSRVLLCETPELFAIVSDLHFQQPVPQFRLDDTSGLADLIEASVLKKTANHSAPL